MNLDFHNMKSSIREDFDELKKANLELISKLDLLQEEVRDLKEDISKSEIEEIDY